MRPNVVFRGPECQQQGWGFLIRCTQAGRAVTFPKPKLACKLHAVQLLSIKADRTSLLFDHKCGNRRVVFLQLCRAPRALWFKVRRCNRPRWGSKLRCGDKSYQCPSHPLQKGPQSHKQVILSSGTWAMPFWIEAINWSRNYKFPIDILHQPQAWENNAVLGLLNDCSVCTESLKTWGTVNHDCTKINIELTVNSTPSPASSSRIF